MVIRSISDLYQSLVWWRLRRKLSTIEVVILDVDGVLTDGGLWYGPDGELTKRFDVRDGLGIRLLQNAGVEVVFLSGGKGGSSEARAKDLGIQHCIVGAKDKLLALNSFSQGRSIPSNRMLFLGDDLNDLAIKSCVHLLIATSDASAPLKKNSDAILSSSGGHGAVRELAEKLLKVKSKWSEVSTFGWRDNND